MCVKCPSSTLSSLVLISLQFSTDNVIASSRQINVKRPKSEDGEECDSDIEDNKTLQTSTGVDLVAEKNTCTALPFVQNKTLSIEPESQMVPSQKHEKPSEEDLNEWEDAEQIVLGMISDCEVELRLSKADIECAKLTVLTREQELEEAKQVLRSIYEGVQDIEAAIRTVRQHLASRHRKVEMSSEDDGQVRMPTREQRLGKAVQAGRSAHEWMIDMAEEIETWREGLSAKRRKLEVPEREGDQAEMSG